MVILNFIVSLYIKISVFDIILFMISIFLTKVGYGERDPFIALNKLNDLLESIPDSRTKNFYINMFNNCINNPMNVLMYEIIFSFIPIFHIFLIISFIKDIFNKLNYRKED